MHERNREEWPEKGQLPPSGSAHDDVFFSYSSIVQPPSVCCKLQLVTVPELIRIWDAALFCQSCHQLT